ncbi:hypothetical protein ACFV20_14195 [Streptomyces sp. NPDC059696]|uniref:hypothetical protein n=1 Tax=Streptomyces sp. NPDC059696 TaxID=3346911 RepID=UPI0036A0B169
MKATGWVPKIGDFKGLTQEDWHDYVLSAHRAYGKPSPREIARNAKKYDKRYAIGKTTIHETLRGRWPTAQTAYRLGLGIGGPDLAPQFRNGWLAADGKMRMEIHRRKMSHVRERLHRYEDDEEGEWWEGERQWRWHKQREQVKREKRRTVAVLMIAVPVIALVFTGFWMYYR